MKRDMDLIRLLLLQIEGEPPAPHLSGYTDQQKLYHLALLIEADLVDGRVVHNGQAEVAQAHVIRLTWKGHEFLDAARDQGVWDQAWKKLREQGFQVTIAVMTELLTAVAKSRLGLG